MLGERISDEFLEKIGGISIFWSFSLKVADSERVFKAVTMETGPREPIGVRNSKSVCNSAPVLCAVFAGARKSCDELAHVGKAETLGMTSFEVI